MNQIAVRRRTHTCKAKKRHSCETCPRKRRRLRIYQRNHAYFGRKHTQKYKRSPTEPNPKSSEGSVIYVGTYKRKSIPVSVIDLTKSTTSLVSASTKSRRKKSKYTEKKTDVHPSSCPETFLPVEYHHFSNRLSVVDFSVEDDPNLVRMLHSTHQYVPEVHPFTK